MNSEFSRRLNRRLLRAFLVQIGLISATAVVGVYLAEFAIRELLIVSALEREADYFWSRQNIDPETKTPNTHALIGYVFDTARPDAYPEEFQDLATGLHDLETPVGQSVVHVSEANGRRLFLVFDANNVRQLATYFGLVPLALLLVVLYSSAWLAYRIAGRAVSPLIKLAREVRELDLESSAKVTLGKQLELQGADEEVLVLSHALVQLVERVNQFVERERILTRETSHELRSPLTVIRIASDMLDKRGDLNDVNRATVDKIQRAAKDMEELIEAFLLLAREDTSSMLTEAVDINNVVRAEFARCELVYARKDLDLEYSAARQLTMTCSPNVLAIVIGNLLRNACAYTDEGYVRVHVDATGVRISDSGVGISDDELKAVFSPYYRAPTARESGHGIGLSLVKRMTDRFGWPIDITSHPGRGTVVVVSFPDARVSAPHETPALQRSAG